MWLVTIVVLGLASPLYTLLAPIRLQGKVQLPRLSMSGYIPPERGIENMLQ